MLWGATTLAELRDAVASMIEHVGEDAAVGRIRKDEQGEFLELGIGYFNWVCIRRSDGQIVGAEGDDYELRLNPETEENAIGVH